MNLRWHFNIVLVKLAIFLLKKTNWYEGYWNHWRSMFEVAQKMELHILPVHYYSPIPDTRGLQESLWEQSRLPIGFDLNIDAALVLLDRLSQKYSSEYGNFRRHDSADPHSYYLDNDAYVAGDAEILYSILRELKPSRIIEIGSGFSTLLICEAIRANHAEDSTYQCNFVAIEPYPPGFITPPPQEVTCIERKPLQEIPVEVFSSLSQNDVLFIDSTHVVKIGSDVVYEFLNILPRLAPGVIVHIHDIFIPFEYPKRWIDEARFFWNEQYLVEAFLTYNTNFEVIMPTHALWHGHTARLKNEIPSLEAGLHSPSSFWIRRKPYA